jgi:hypothetical protein
MVRPADSSWLGSASATKGSTTITTTSTTSSSSSTTATSAASASEQADERLLTYSKDLVKVLSLLPIVCSVACQATDRTTLRRVLSQRSAAWQDTVCHVLSAEQLLQQQLAEGPAELVCMMLDAAARTVGRTEPSVLQRCADLLRRWAERVPGASTEQARLCWAVLTSVTNLCSQGLASGAMRDLSHTEARQLACKAAKAVAAAAAGCQPGSHGAASSSAAVDTPLKHFLLAVADVIVLSSGRQRAA